MTRLTTVCALTVMLVAGRATAQTPPPTTPPPTQTPPAAQTPAKAPEPVPFPPDAKVAFIDLQAIVSASKLGKEGRDKMQALDAKLASALAAKNKEIQSLQERLKTQQGVVSDAVYNQMVKDLDRLQREATFMQQDAQVQVEQLNEELLGAFQRQVMPIVEEVRKERGLWIIFALGENSNIAAAHPGLDLSSEIVKRLDAIK